MVDLRSFSGSGITGHKIMLTKYWTATMRNSKEKLIAGFPNISTIKSLKNIDSNKQRIAAEENDNKKI